MLATPRVLTMPSIVFLDVALAVLGLYCVKQLCTTKSRSPFPPGPKPLPLLGNLLDMPNESPWETFAKWGEKHGSIMSVNVMGQRVIILNSAEHAINLLEKRSTTSSNRPNLQLAGEMIGWNKSLVLSQYGKHFKEYRKHIHRIIGTRAGLEKFYPLVERQVQRFLQKLIQEPEEFASHSRWLSGALILVISHGYEAEIQDDPFIKTAETAIHYFSITTVAGASIVDVLPILKHLPSWFPGVTFHKIAMAGKQALDEMADRPHEFVKEEMAAGTAKPSFTSALLEGTTPSTEEEYIVKWSAQTLYSGGADTTVAALHAFFLAMTLYPDVQRKAQAELDAKIGPDRLPTLHDREDLPYINALNLELFRWYTLAPLGVAHVMTDDDTYEGYFIPKGSFIFPNIWAILRNPEVYSDPLEFKPERFIPTKDKQPETDPHNACFGFGRRQCPGMVFAEMSLFIESAMILSMFNIRKVTEDGKTITPEFKQTTGTIRCVCIHCNVNEPFERFSHFQFSVSFQVRHRASLTQSRRHDPQRSETMSRVWRSSSSSGYITLCTNTSSTQEFSDGLDIGNTRHYGPRADYYLGGSVVKRTKRPFSQRPFSFFTSSALTTGVMSVAGGFAVQPQPFSPSSGTQIQAGAITYTTSTSPDGTVTYHPFRAVPASYQTPQGVVHGIQWVPAEATQILPPGAQPATAEFAASWNRGYLSKDDEKALEKWQKSEEKRRKKEEKESIRRLSKHFEKDREEAITRERRRSFYGDAPPPAPGYATSGGAPYGAYAYSPSNVSELDRKFNEIEIERESRYSTRQRKYSTSGGDRTSVYGPPPGAPSSVASYQSPTGYPTTGTSPYNRASSPYRQPSVYSTSPNPRPQEFSTYPGGPDPIARAASPYGRPESLARAASPYARPEPIARAASPYGRPEPIARAASPYNRPEPIARAASPYGRPVEVARATSPYAPSHSLYGGRAPSPLPNRAPSPYAKGPPQGHLRSASPMPRAPSPYVPPPVINSTGVYPSGHVLEGQPLPRSRAPSPMPGPAVPAFPSSPRIGGSVVGGEQQLTAPEAFSRPANAAQPYTPFSIMKIQDMEQFYDQIPRMPLVLDTHDVYHQDWIRFMNDLALAWAGRMPIPEFNRNNPPKRSALVADLIDLWNANFFITRRVEVVLYKGHERRSGPNAGTIDYQLPNFDDYSSDDTSSLSSSSDSDSDRYPGYGRGVDTPEARRRRREKKEEKKRRKKEKKLKRKAKEREKTHALYLAYVPPRDVPTGYYA